MKAFQRILAVLLCLVMSLGMISMVASAESIITGTEGSITIHKYEYNVDDKNPAGSEGTGAANDNVPSGAKPLDGVKFKITKVAELNTYYGPDAKDLPTVAEAKAMPAIGEPKEDVTANGEVKFENLELGLYLVQELDAPAQITGKTPDFLVSIPMTNATGDGWLYDVHVFPKNSSTYASVTLLKQGRVGNGTPTALEGATFKLQVMGTTWTDVTKNNKDEELGTLTTNASGKITVSDLAPGDYRFIETSVGNGYIMDGETAYEFTIADGSDAEIPAGSVVINGEVVDTNQNPITVINEKPDATKEITAGQDTTMVGKKVSYKVTVDVPTNITKLNKFTVTDAPNGLKVDLTTNFSVKCEGTDVATTVYDAPTATANGGFELKFKPTLMANYAGKTIEITYKAEITSDAIENNKATNTVTVTYNDKVGVDHDSSITTDTPETDLYDVTITKYKNSVADTNKLDGVKFVLYKDSVAEANKVQVTDQGQGNYNVADSDDSSTVTEMTTANRGNLKISGLANGTYYLVETATVAGYNLLKEPVEITVNNADIGAGTINVINKEGFTLPQTGGIGTLMFIIIGGVLMAGGICLIVPNKKRAI